MSDCYEDREATIRMIIGEYQTLQKLNPKNKLLKLVEKVDSTGFDTTKSFFRKYSELKKGHKSGNGKFVSMAIGYYFDLNKEIIERLLRLLSEEKGKTEEDLWKIMEEKGLVGIVRTHLTHNEMPLMNFVQ